MFFTSSFSAALTALLAEHDLGYIELVPQNSFAKELKEGIIGAFRVGAREGHRFERQWWIEKFNGSSRLVQLNFVAFGLNELGLDPLLEEYWPRVQNPMVLNIERKLDKAKRYVERRHGTRIQIRESRLRLEDWGLVDQFYESAQTPKDAPNLTFMSTFPDSGSCTPVQLKFGDFVISYYENPKTIGEDLGIPDLFTYPQVAIVSALDEADSQLSQLSVRVENSSFGVPMLCSMDAAGTHSNFGEWSQTDRDSFVRRAVEIASQCSKWRTLQTPHGTQRGLCQVASADQNPQTAGTHSNFDEWSQKVQTDFDSFTRRAVEFLSDLPEERTPQTSPSADQNPQKAVITCPSCRSSLRVPKSRSGKIRCPSCQNLFEVTT